MLDCLIVGGGPAGLTAAIYLARFRREVRVIDGGSVRDRTVTLGAMNDHEVIVTSGLEPGVTLQRHVAR